MSSPYPYDGLGTFSPKALSYSVARKQVSQGGAGDLGLSIVDSTGQPVDATDIEVRIQLDEDFDETQASLFDDDPAGHEIAHFIGAQVLHDDLGFYHVEIGPTVTQDRGNLKATWTYKVSGQEQTYVDYLEIIEHMPDYDALRPEEKTIVEQVTWLFADLFDSTNGGPNLQENFQTHFGYNRIAQLMQFAMIRFNTQAVPITNFGLGEGSRRLPPEFHGILVMGTYLEVLLHLIRSYTEQPNLPGMTVTYTDRRDYAQRWKAIYDPEKETFDAALKLAKRKLMGLGGGSLLVAGGIYGNRGWFRSGTYAMQTRAARFYPASTAVIRI